MPRAVRFDEYGGIDVLYIAEVPMPQPDAPDTHEVVVEVKAAGINPGEASIRKGLLDAMFPATFPSGEGTDFAGIVHSIGDEVTDFAVGDEVIGWSEQRSSHADYVKVPSKQLVVKPPLLPWPQAGGLFVVAVTAYAAVRAIAVQPGETVVVSAAAGGVGVLTVQLLKIKGANVIGIASAPNHAWLTSHGVTPVAYGDGLADRVRALAPQGIDAFIDLFGPQYVDLAIELGVPPDRVETIIAYEAAAKYGAKADGSSTASSTDVLEEMAEYVSSGRMELPIAKTYPLDQVRQAYAELEKRHTRGKIVLIP